MNEKAADAARAPLLFKKDKPRWRMNENAAAVMIKNAGVCMNGNAAADRQDKQHGVANCHLGICEKKDAAGEHEPGGVED